MSGWVESAVESWGYLGVGFMMFLENVFPPIPSEVVMPLAGFLTEGEEISYFGVVAAGMVGSVAGALPLYYLGRWLGEERLERWVDAHGHWLLLTTDELGRAQRWFDERGSAAVFFGRLVPGVRSLISVPAGLYRMPLGRFLAWTAAGTALWAALLAYLGKLLGHEYQAVERYLGPAAYVVLGALVIWYLLYAFKLRRENKAGEGA